MSKARGTAVASLTALIAALMIPLAMPGTAQAGYQVSKTVGIRMLDVNVLRSDCRTYPVEWVVGNFNESWGTTGYTWDWRLTLTLANPKHPEERSATIRLAGVDAKSGRTSFRLCGTKHSAGRFVATAKVSASPRAASDCAPLDNDVVFPPLPADVGRTCSFNSGFGEDRAQITTLFKRPTKVTLQAGSFCGRLDDVRVFGTVYRQSDRGTWSRVGRGVAVNIRVVGDPSFPPPTVSPRVIGRAFTDERGQYARTRLTSPSPFVDVQATVASTGRHVAGNSPLVSLEIACP